MASVNDKRKAAGTGGGKRSAPGATYSRNKTVGRDTTPQVERAYNNLSSIQKQASSSLGLTKAQALQLNERQAANVNNNINRYSEAQKAQLRSMYSNVTTDRANRSGSSGLNKIELQQYKQAQAQKSFGSVGQSGSGVTVRQAPKFIQRGSAKSRVSNLKKYNNQTKKWEIPANALNNLSDYVKTQGDYNIVSELAQKELYNSTKAERVKILKARNYIVNRLGNSYQADQYKKYYNNIEKQAQYDRARTVASTPITVDMSAAEKKRIQAARAWVIKQYPTDSETGKTTNEDVAEYYKSIDYPQKAQTVDKILSEKFLSQTPASLKAAGYSASEIKAILKKQKALKDSSAKYAKAVELKVSDAEKWSKEYNKAIKGKNLTWSASSVRSISAAQKAVNAVVSDKKHPYVSLPKNTIVMLAGLPKGLLASADYALQTKGKSLTPQVKAFARGAAEFPFAAVDASGRVMGRNGHKDLAALQSLLDMAVTTVMLGAAGKGIKRVSPVKLIDVSVPGAKAQNYRGVGVGIKTKGTKAILGVKDGKLIKGTPKFDIEAGYTPFTPMETAIVKPSIKRTLTKTEAKRWEAGFKLIETFKKTKPLQKERVNLGEIKAIPAEAVKPVSTWLLKQKGSKIFGSAAQKAQIGKGRIPGDIDIGVKGNPTVAAKQLFTELQKLDAKKYKLNKNVIESLGEDGKYHHMIDIHALKDMEGGYMSYAYKSQKRIKIQGEGQIRIGEQFTRKGVSVLVSKGEGTFGPKAHRIKDLVDFTQVAEDLVKAKGEKASGTRTQGLKQIRTRKAVKAQKDLDIFKGTAEQQKAVIDAAAKKVTATKVKPSRSRRITKTQRTTRVRNTKYPEAVKGKTSKVYPVSVKPKAAKVVSSAYKNKAKSETGRKYPTVKTTPQKAVKKAVTGSYSKPVKVKSNTVIGTYKKMVPTTKSKYPTVVKSASKSSGTVGGTTRVPPKDKPPIPGIRKKKLKGNTDKKIGVRYAKGKRIIRNKLGSFESILGSNTAKKTVGKPAAKKPAAKKPAARKTAKR